MYYQGSCVLSNFRREKILETAQTLVPSLTTLSAYYLYFVDTTQPLSASEDKQLSTLLPDIIQDKIILPNQQFLLVIPRPGTISPWSSKATEITHVCGLNTVKRLERGVLWILTATSSLDAITINQLATLVHDRMTETVLFTVDNEIIQKTLFQSANPRTLQIIPILQQGKPALIQANQAQGLALSDEEITYLVESFTALQRNPTDAELVMFAQANSEHCRHKIFNANWVIDGQAQNMTLFQMIRHTHAQHPGHVISAYQDNAAVMEGFTNPRLLINPLTHHYEYVEERTAILMKVETHNHPTAISPFPGAATGSGGEIRDEGATGRGAKPKAGLTGFSVSHLHIPDAPQLWETSACGTPTRLATALQIMLEAPIGAAAFNNEFGRPAICGYFRSFEQEINGKIYGYHKPIMLAGGIGNIRQLHIEKKQIPPGSALIVLGGPAMLIGLGGGAASSLASGYSSTELDFASVQRSNAEMQRRCQEVIDACWALGVNNPLLSIHDVGAGGLSNALPELVQGSECGGRFDLQAIPSADPSLSPMEIWCNEAQERYVLAIAQENLSLFQSLCERERCPFAVVGEAIASQQLQLYQGDTPIIDMPLAVLFGKPPKMHREVSRITYIGQKFDFEGISPQSAALQVLSLPTVASKNFLITIGDRSVGGLVVRDQMVGPWQVPVADCAVMASCFHSETGEAMAIGERTPLALFNPEASARMAIGEAITNLSAACIDRLDDIVLSANWMAACGQPGQDSALFDAVRAAALELCPALGIAIPVGKDSLSMHTLWQDESLQAKSVTSPLSLIVSAFARVLNIHDNLTPQLQNNNNTLLILIDLGRGKNRLGGSALTQVYNQWGETTPDLEDPQDLVDFFNAIQALNQQGKILAYHDRSDGGLLVTLCEMAFAGHMGLDIHLEALGTDIFGSLFNEELGAVIQVHKHDATDILKWFGTYTKNRDLSKHVHVLGTSKNHDMLNFHYEGSPIISFPRTTLQQVWSRPSYELQKLRDNPLCAQQEFESLLDAQNPGLSLQCTFALQPTVRNAKNRPHLAILREQGVNGHVEMAAAFEYAGFTAVDVHMSDILSGRMSLRDFQGFVACGGFSYGDVLGAGGGWAKTILFNSRAFDEFSAFFQRLDTFALGICNGCQMMAQLRDLIPGAQQWCQFARNQSEQFEARLVMVEVLDSPSLFLQGMGGSQLPIVVAHGEGRAELNEQQIKDLGNLVALRYINNYGQISETYPANPNGSPLGVTGLTTPDGRFTIMMPHPERVFLRSQWSWLPETWSQVESPWMQLFWNARRWVGE